MNLETCNCRAFIENRNHCMHEKDLFISQFYTKALNVLRLKIGELDICALRMRKLKNSDKFRRNCVDTGIQNREM